jgi:aryl-alcohol dehydrogenase-like predicted oxidoreductase
MERREFLKSVGTSAAAAAATGYLQAESGPASAPSSNAARLPRRPYGKTGIDLSIVGLGGMLLNGLEPAAAKRIVAEDVERGGNYFDVAPTYGNAEQLLGPALEPYRKRVFLAVKTTQRTRDKARAEFERSLQRLGTDHVDLYQLHGITDVAKDVDVAFARGGAMEFLLAARREGRIRHLGFSAHTLEAARAAMDRFDFHSVLFPVNFAAMLKAGFGQAVLDQARARGMAVLALKAMARQAWPKDHPDRKRYANCWYQPLSDPHEAALALRFTLDQPVTAAVPPGDIDLFRMAMEIAAAPRPLQPAELRELETLAAGLLPLFPQP